MRKDNEKKNAESLRFVVEHFEPKAFNESESWKALGFIRKMTALWAWRAGAAAAVVLAGIAMWIFSTTKSAADGTIDITAEAKGTYVLPDSSVVTLARGSRMHYDSESFGRDRLVGIEGKAFLRVTPDKAHPFRVEAGETEITVVGTEFGIETLDATTTEVYVTSGCVNVEMNGHMASVTKGCIAIATAEGIEVMRNASPNIATWATGQVEFDDTPLSEAIKLIEEAFEVKINAKRHSNDLRISISYQGDVEELIDVMNRAYNLDLSVDNK